MRALISGCSPRSMAMHRAKRRRWRMGCRPSCARPGPVTSPGARISRRPDLHVVGAQTGDRGDQWGRGGHGSAHRAGGHLRFMAEDAVLTLSFSERGLIAEWGVSWLLPRLVGPAVALDLLFRVARSTGGRPSAWASSIEPCQPATCFLLPSPTSKFGQRLLAPVALHHQATGVPAAPRWARPSRDRSPSPHARELARADFKEGIDSFVQRRSPSFDRLGDHPTGRSD